MITGARQVGKTYVIRKYAREHFEYVVEINFIENQDAIGLFENAKPVGYMTVMEMYPMDFFEFCRANKVSEKVMEHLKECFTHRLPADQMIHDKMMSLFQLYLIIGGMPAVVDTYIRTNNLKTVMEIQKGIVYSYIRDIAKYDPEGKLYLKDIFELIPSERRSRFIPLI